MSKPKITLLSEGEIRNIHNATLEVLENTGIRVGGKRTLAILEEAGARVDYEESKVMIPGNLVEEALRRAPKTVKLCARNPKYDVLLNKKETYFITDGIDIPFIRDWETGERRTSTNEDLARWTRLSDYLDNIHFVWVTLAAVDVSPKMQSLTQLVTTLNNTEKHVEYEAHNAMEAQYMIEIASAIAGGREKLRENPIISAVQCPASPLMFDQGTIEAAMEFARAGIPVVYMDMPLTMETCPATLAGTLVIVNAENLAGLVISEFTKSGAPVMYSTCASITDPLSGAAIESSESSLIYLASTQIAHYYGLPCEICGSGSMSKMVDAQAGYEMAMSINQNLPSGADIICGLGDLEIGLCVSPEKLVIDNEIVGESYRFTRGFRINDDSLALDVIHKVGPGGHFLAEKHTLKHFRELGRPQLGDVNAFETWKKRGSKSIYDVAKEKVKEILATHKPEPIPVAAEEEISKILKRARAEMLKKN